MITAEQLKALQDRVEQLHRYLDIDAKTMQLSEDANSYPRPTFWETALALRNK